MGYPPVIHVLIHKLSTSAIMYVYLIARKTSGSGRGPKQHINNARKAARPRNTSGRSEGGGRAPKTLADEGQEKDKRERGTSDPTAAPRSAAQTRGAPPGRAQEQRRGLFFFFFFSPPCDTPPPPVSVLKNLDSPKSRGHEKLAHHHGQTRPRVLFPRPLRTRSSLLFSWSPSSPHLMRGFLLLISRKKGDRRAADATRE